MTNGSVAITEGLLQRSGLDEYVCLKLDVAGPQKWKPAKEAYRYAVESLQLQGTPEQAGGLVAMEKKELCQKSYQSCDLLHAQQGSG